MEGVAAAADGWRGDDRRRRWQRPRAAVAMAEGGSGGRQEKFCDVVLKFCDVDLLFFFNNYFVIL